MQKNIKIDEQTHLDEDSELTKNKNIQVDNHTHSNRLVEVFPQKFIIAQIKQSTFLCAISV